MTCKRKNLFVKILMIVLMITICFSAVSLIGCKNEQDQIVFKTTEMKYMVGDNVDCFSFVEWLDGYDFDFAIQKVGEDKKTEISGRTFVVHNAGEYNLYCTATKGETVLEDSTVITIYHTIPVALVPNSDMVRELYDEVPLFSLVSMNGGVRMISSDSETITLVDSAVYYENETDTEGDTVVYYDVSKPIEDFNITEYKKKKIYFDKEGIWYFSVYIQNEGGTTKGKFRVTISENLEVLEDVTAEVGATFDEKTLQASWGAVDGAVGYRAKVRSYVLSTESPKADMSNAYYPPFTFFDFVVVPYDKDGKNIGKKIVVENCVVSPKGYEGVVLNDKAVIDQKTREVTLTSARISQSYWWTGINGTVDKTAKGAANVDPINGFVGMKGNYGVGHYVETVFGESVEDVGQLRVSFGSCNMPQIILFADDINGNKSDLGGKGILLSSGLGAWAENTWLPSLVDSMNYFGAHGTNRATYGGAKTDLPTLVKTRDYPLLTQNGMKEFGGGKTYKYIVGTKYSEWGTVLIDITLLVQQGNDFVEIKTADGKSYTNILLDTYLTKEDVEQLGTNIILIAENKFKVYESTTKFSFELPEFKGVGVENPTAVAYVNEKIVSGEAGNITLNSANVASGQWWKSLDGTVDTTISSGKGANPVNGYLAFKGNFGVGYYIETEFGASKELVNNVETDFGSCNMPQIVLFADEINGNKTNTGGKGILLSSGLGAWWENAVVTSLTNTMDYFGVHGPDRATYVGAKKDLPTLIKTSDYPLLTQNGMKELGGGKTYKYIVGTKYSLWGRLLIDITLLVKDGEEFKEIKTGDGKSYTNILLDTGLTKTDVESLGTNIILMAENKYKVFGGTTTFKFKTPEYKDSGASDLLTTASGGANGATFNADGSISIINKSVAGTTAKLAGQWAIYHNYFALKGDYGVGYYMDFEFKGINMPQLILFAGGTHDTETSAYQSITNYGTGNNAQNSTQQGRKGVVILNGLSDKGDYLQVFGPNRMNGSDEYGVTGKSELLTLSKNDYAELTRTGQKSNLEKEYALTIGTFIGSDQKVWIDILLKDAKTDATIHSVQSSLGLTEAEVGTGDIIILPPFGDDGTLVADGTTTCTIDYISVPYKKTNA